MNDSLIHADIEQEALRLIEAAREQGITLRLLGGLAIKLHSPSADHSALARTYPDIDYATDKAGGRQVEDLLAGMGYTPNRAFNTLNGDRRLLLYDEVHGRQVDVFINAFEMCHKLPVAERLTLEPFTLPLAELLLTKLQVVEMNERDVRDICALLLDHPVGRGDAETVNSDRIAELCAKDWGLYKTVEISLDKIRDLSDAYPLEPDEKATIVARVDAIREAMQNAPKTLGWRTRAKVGTRMRWYDLPEEVQRRVVA